MKKRIVSIILAVTVIVCMIPFSTFSAFAEEISDNEEDTVIEISELSLLQSFAQSVNTGDTDFSDVTVRLTGDIGSEEDDCQLTESIGVGNAFNGTFDGGGHTVWVDNIYGLFGSLKNATVKNVTVCGSVLNTEDNNNKAGAIACKAENSVISNCINYADVTATSAGGIVCTAINTKITGCINYGKITGGNSENKRNPYAGGIAARAEKVFDKDEYGKIEIFNCLNLGDVIAVSMRVEGTAGGLLGAFNYSSVKIVNSASFANVSSSHIAGSIIGSDNEFIGQYESEVTITLDNVFSGGTISYALLDGGSVIGIVEPETVTLESTRIFTTLISTVASDIEPIGGLPYYSITVQGVTDITDAAENLNEESINHFDWYGWSVLDGKLFIKSHITVYEEVPATCVAFGTKAYYEFKGDYFKDPECNNKIDDLTAWLKNYTESGGLILPLGHMGVPCENVTDGHYCLREGCPYAGKVLMHDFNDDDTACPACGVRCAKGCDHDPTCSDFYAFYAEFKNDGSALTSTWYYIDESITLDTPLIIAGEDVRLLIADNVTLNAAAGYYVKSGSSFDVYYQSRGENAGKFEGTICKCYDETNMEAYFDHSDVDTDGICDHCLKAVTKYLDENGDDTYINTENLNVIPSDATEIRSGWYIADYEGGKLASFSERLKITGDVHIILLDSKNVISRSGIAVNKGNTLSFYSQSFGDKMGKFETYGVTDAYIGCAGIGGSLGNPDAGTVNIYGGGFKIYAGTGAAAIGGGLGGDGATVTVYNGDINASGSIGAAGIGGGFNGDGVSFVMYGGTVNAKAGTGATAGQDGAGIGGGYNGTSGKIEIANTIASLTANGGRALGSGKGIVQDVNSIKLAKGLLATSNGKTVENIDIETEIVIVPENNKYNGISLTLDSDICMNFYMELSEDARENGKMVFTIGGRTVEDVTVQQNPNGYYFTCPLTALEMATEVEATFSYEGLKYKQTYSVEEYIQSILDGNYSDETKTLARKIANYGHYAQSYLADIHNKVTIGDGGYAPMEKYSQCDIDAETDIGRFTDEFEAPAPTNDYELYGRTVYFDSATALNYYVTVKNGNSLTADAITCFDKGGNNRNFEVKFFKDDIYIVSVKGIAATELNDTFKVTIGDSFVLESSVLNYCGAVVKAHSGDTSSDKLAVNAMAAFYEYYDAATDYAESLGK